MNHPITWVVTTPSNDVNGEDGTIQAGEYAKGDTATLFVYQEDGHVDVSRSLIRQWASDDLRNLEPCSLCLFFVIEPGLSKQIIV